MKDLRNYKELVKETVEKDYFTIKYSIIDYKGEFENDEFLSLENPFDEMLESYSLGDSKFDTTIENAIVNLIKEANYNFKTRY